jgi:predicted ferric reductase
VTLSRGGLNRIQWALGGVLLTVLALWLATMPFGGLGLSVFALRAPSLQATGTLAMAAMSVAMVLATRPVFFERWLGGLDKMYRLHKWLGISALLFAVSHWLWVEAPKWMTELGWLVRPVRAARLPSAEPEPAVFALLHGLRGPAEGLGEWAFYAMVLLIALALWKRFPYRRFFQTHRLLPVVYLVLVFHAVVLTSDGSWTQPVGVVMALLMLAGTVAALMVLFGAVGRSRQAVAEVEATSLPAGADVLQVDVQLKSRWAGHEAGQFAFVRFDKSEGAHPFTIISPWTGDGRLVFLIKGLGDHTRQLPSLLNEGDLLRVEGPYGTFNFAGEKRHQVWLGGGIGITPFIARLQQLALQPDGKTVDLFYTTATPRDGAVARLAAAALAVGARLHVMVEAVDGRLNAERLCAAVPDWRSADVWFCGPADFGKALRHDLMAMGLAGRDFHQELFNLR